MPENENPATPPNGHTAFNGPPANSGTSLVQVTAEEWNRLLGYKTERDSLLIKHTSDLAVKEADRLKAIAEKDGVEKALGEQRMSWEKQIGEERGKLSKVRDLYHGKAKAEALSAPMTGVEFAGATPEGKVAAASQFRSIVEPLFETYEDDGGNLFVRQKGTGRPAADVMKELLNAPEYQHFFAPKTRGGSGTDGTRAAGVQATADNPDGNPHKPYTQEWFVFRHNATNVANQTLRLRPRSK